MIFRDKVKDREQLNAALDRLREERERDAIAWANRKYVPERAIDVAISAASELRDQANTLVLLIDAIEQEDTPRAARVKVLEDAVRAYLAFSDKHRGDDYFDEARRAVRLVLDAALEDTR